MLHHLPAGLQQALIVLSILGGYLHAPLEGHTGGLLAQVKFVKTLGYGGLA
jgi:hypothetical protein